MHCALHTNKAREKAEAPHVHRCRWWWWEGMDWQLWGPIRMEIHQWIFNTHYTRTQADTQTCTQGHTQDSESWMDYIGIDHITIQCNIIGIRVLVWNMDQRVCYRIQCIVLQFVMVWIKVWYGSKYCNGIVMIWIKVWYGSRFDIGIVLVWIKGDIQTTRRELSPRQGCNKFPPPLIGLQ